MSPLPSTPAAPSSAVPAALRAGFLAAVGTWAVVGLPALLGWVAAPESTLGWFSAVSVGSALWFLGHGQSVGVAGGVTVSLTPLLLLLLFVHVAFRFARRLVATQRLRVGPDAWSHVAAYGVVPGFLAGYGAGAALFGLCTLGGPATPGFAAVPGALLVPLAGLGFVLLRPDHDDAPAFVKAWFRRGPTWLPTVWRTGWHGAALFLVVGGVVVAARIVVAWPDVVGAQQAFGADVGATVVLGLAQLSLLGNAATWALGFLAGPGFQVAAGSLTSPAGAHPGLLPLVPVLGALPHAASYPTAMWAVVLVPVAVGAHLARRVDHELEFFGNVRNRVMATLTAALLPVLVVVVLTGLADGAVGAARLAAVGVPVLPFALALAAETALGAMLWLAALEARERSGDDAADPGDEADAVEGDGRDGRERDVREHDALEGAGRATAGGGEPPPGR